MGGAEDALQEQGEPQASEGGQGQGEARTEEGAEGTGADASVSENGGGGMGGEEAEGAEGDEDPWGPVPEPPFGQDFLVWVQDLEVRMGGDAIVMGA